MTNLLIGRLKVNWKQIPNIMMKLYIETTYVLMDYIEDKQIALVWFYEDADQDVRQKAKLKNF
ncbi:UDP-glycosyltransferase/trehalose-phosphatase family protein, putative [Medicago truncatula]|uniref:UDP-glycosyltransferase/trehalose-phosphatase family protein, putative n=1 Tax=Medicago truncatula TaxID=3880 RepID=G7J6J9_MEDTR|nr:UDP-glycosyltransferase/trehalose-phosphatase family protein, putative [Medicago truncatula]